MFRALLASIIIITLAVPAAAVGYVPGDAAVPVFTSTNLGSFQPGPETPTNHSMVSAPPITQPATQTGPAGDNAVFSGSVTGATLTITGTAPPNFPTHGTVQITGAGIVGSASGNNFPTIISGSGSSYTLSNTTASPTGAITITAQPLGVTEDAIAAWDTQFNQTFDTGFAFGCLHANAQLGIDHVDFRLNGGATLITATSTTLNSVTGAPDYCWAAPISLFAGANGKQQVDAVVYPVAGVPVVMSSVHFVTAAPSASIFSIPAVTFVNSGPIAAPTSPKFAYITNSSDSTTFPTAATFTPSNVAGTISYAGVYCVLPLDADRFELEEASYVAWPGHRVFESNCNIQLLGTIDNTGKMTITGQSGVQPGGQIIIGQIVTGTTVPGNTKVTANLGSNQYQLSTSGYTVSVAETLTFSGAIPATASGATFDLIPFHAGSTLELQLNQSNGSDFFNVNPSGSANSIPEISAFFANTGNNANPATSASPAATASGAMAAVTATNGAPIPFVAANVKIQTLTTTTATGATCTAFSRSGNTSGAVPYQIRQPVKFNGITASNGVFVNDATYFVKDAATNGLATDVMTLSGLPGGPCISDPNLVSSATASCTGSGSCIHLGNDYSFTTLLGQCVSSGPITCDGGHPATFALGDGSAVLSHADYGFMTITFDSATSNFENVVLTSAGTGGNTGTNNDATAGLGVDNLRAHIKGVEPTVTVHLLHPINKGDTVTGIDVATSELASFPIIPKTAGQQGSQTTELAGDGNCIPPSGGLAGTGGMPSYVAVPTAPTTAGSTTTIPLVADTGVGLSTPVTLVAFNDCPIGTPITLLNFWNYQAAASTITPSGLWLDHSALIMSYPDVIAPVGGGLSQPASGQTTEITSTGSSIFGMNQGYNNIEYIANSLAYGSMSKALNVDFTIVNSTVDRSGVEAATLIDQIGNAGSGFSAYGLAADEITDTATINGTIVGTTLTVNSIASGTPVAGMGLFVSGMTNPGGVILLQQTGANTFLLNAAVTGTGVTAVTMTPTRSIWRLGMPGNTTPGATVPLPRFSTTWRAQWNCTSTSHTWPVVYAAVTGWDENTSTVILANAPTSTCVLSDGQSFFGPGSNYHEDMMVWQPVGGFNAGVMIYGLSILNSQGYGWANLEAGVFQNSLMEASNDAPYFSGAGAGGDYAALQYSGGQRNSLFRQDTFTSLSTSFTGRPDALVVTNGTLSFQGVNCGAQSGFWTAQISTFTGLGVINSNWPTAPSGASAGTC